jgi:hypothetical protein
VPVLSTGCGGWKGFRQKSDDAAPIRLFFRMWYHVPIKGGETVDNPVILGIAFTIVPFIILLFMFLVARKEKKQSEVNPQLMP